MDPTDLGGSTAIVEATGHLHSVQDGDLNVLYERLAVLCATPTVATIILDLTTVMSMSSGAIGPIALALKEFTGTNRRLIVVVAPGSRVENLLHITKMEVVLTIVHSRDEALTRT